MADEKQTGGDPVSETRSANIYLARLVNEQILAYKGVLPQYERNTLARNLAEIIGRAKAEKKNFKKGDIVIKAGVRPGTSDAGAVNALNSYCLLPEYKSKRKAKARLHAHPLNYLKLALSAAELAGWPRHKAIMMLTEGSNAFSGRSEIDMVKFTPAEAVWQLLRAKLAVLVESPKYRLREFFRSAQELSAVHGYDLTRNITGWQQEEFGDRSTSHWPTVCLTTIIRSSASARLLFEGADREVNGEVIGAEEACLTLGWDLADKIVGYMEFWPCLAVRPLAWHPEAPWVDFGTIDKVPHEGRFEKGRFRLVEGATVEMPPGTDGNTWPYRLRSHARFEPITPALLAETFIDCQVLQTGWHKLNSNLDTSEVMSPASSPLAWMEAELLGRETLSFGTREKGFLEELESNVERFVSSFREWRDKATRNATQDHQTIMLKMMAELDALRGSSVKKED
ncbi:MULTISPECIES: hypothetical protein [unclassified Acidocella]|uniref:hypothetical protein n=1 Tax=unclassified Acidocella TaxID=2648610 RepID=UPI00028E3473|nr:MULTISPECIES: hypothetical protein [unclassified Acidocella]EKM98224.1 hypothetical protein MXAZACID_16559 [Acidocella sp. MX-AZ02]WBO61025.1 hypothetical protein GT370_10105 [Acidocella sp. MX-AZ03]